MKKQLLLIGLIFGMFTAFSQEVTKTDNATDNAKVDTATVADDYCPHRIFLRFGGGWSNDVYKKDVIKYSRKPSYTVMAELGYAYLWKLDKVNLGIGIGAGIGHTRTLAVLKDNYTKDVNDPGYITGDPEARYDLTYNLEDFKERQRVWAVEIPLTMQLEKKFANGRNGIYFGFGVKGYIPFSANVSFPESTLDLKKIDDKGLNWHPTDKNIDVHLGEYDLSAHSARNKMRCSIDVIADFGGIFGISRSTDLYIGIYGSYGFLDITPKEKTTGVTFVPDQRVDFNGFVASTDKKWNLIQAGLKLGFHFLPCASCGNGEYMNDLKRKYMDEMMKKKNEPIIVTNTVQEYYYIVPTVSQELLEENDPAKKKAILDLAESLSNIKILFDLDKDIPKLDDNKKDHIKRASELLRDNPDLKVIVTGYTSPEGTRAHNQDLGNRRAVAVRQHFIDRGVPQDQIAVQNYTAEDPEHKQAIPEKDYKEQRAVIFKIEKK